MDMDIGMRMHMDKQLVHDKPLIDLYGPSIRTKRPTPQHESEAESERAQMLPSRRSYANDKAVFENDDREAVFTEIRSKSALYSLGEEELESIVASVVCEEGFADLVRPLESFTVKLYETSELNPGFFLGQENAKPLASQNQDGRGDRSTKLNKQGRLSTARGSERTRTGSGAMQCLTNQYKVSFFYSYNKNLYVYEWCQMCRSVVSVLGAVIKWMSRSLVVPAMSFHFPAVLPEPPSRHVGSAL
jgi:hypothetical protein